MLETYISNIQHFNVHDGNGFRTTVFLQGCGLRCKWCQNPELISALPVMIYNKELCYGCGQCKLSCRGKAILSNENGQLQYDASKCKKCFQCENECYFGAISFSSHLMSVDDVIKECLKDQLFYNYHNGGVTLSGGEPLLKAEFVNQLLLQLKNNKINTTVETSGFVPWENIEKNIPFIDTFFYDLKLINRSKREYWLGTDNDCILNNLMKLSSKHTNIVIRIPLIPGVNDSKEEYSAIINFVDQLQSIKFIHILPFHQLGQRKYEMIRENYELANLNMPTQGVIDWCKNYAISHGYNVDIGGSKFTEE